MPNTTEIRDGGGSPNTPAVEQMRESQRKGSVGTGTDESYADKMAAKNHGNGLGEGSDEQFPEPGENGGGKSGLPWL